MFLVEEARMFDNSLEYRCSVFAHRVYRDTLYIENWKAPLAAKLFRRGLLIEPKRRAHDCYYAKNRRMCFYIWRIRGR